jgi:uncharacterized protein YodC (DUF2158 family)
MNGFKDGDIVNLVSGGPLMTVEMTRTDGVIPAVWFEGGELHRDCFDPSMLQKWVKWIND